MQINDKIKESNIHRHIVYTVKRQDMHVASNFINEKGMQTPLNKVKLAPIKIKAVRSEFLAKILFFNPFVFNNSRLAHIPKNKQTFPQVKHFIFFFER